MKKKVLVSIDEFSHANAQKKGLNISEVCDRAIREKSGNTIDADEELKSCCKCGLRGDAIKMVDGKEVGELFWLCPDEVWICNKCNKQEVRKIVVGVIPS